MYEDSIHNYGEWEALLDEIARRNLERARCPECGYRGGEHAFNCPEWEGDEDDR